MAWCGAGAEGRAAARWPFLCPVITSDLIFLHKPVAAVLLSILLYCTFSDSCECMIFLFIFSWSACFPLLLSSPTTKREARQVLWPSSSLSSFQSSSSSFPLRILKLSIAVSALREERLCLQRLLRSAWASIPIWITFTTVGVDVCLGIFYLRVCFLLHIFVEWVFFSKCFMPDVFIQCRSQVTWCFHFITSVLGRILVAETAAARHDYKPSQHIPAGLKGQGCALWCFAIS